MELSYGPGASLAHFQPIIRIDLKFGKGGGRFMKEKMKMTGWKKSFKKDWQIWAMILPALIWVIMFCYTPMYGIRLAFRQYDFRKGLTGGDWAGIQYFKQYFTSPMFGTTIKNTFIIAFTSIIVGFPMPILLAIGMTGIKKEIWQITISRTI